MNQLLKFILTLFISSLIISCQPQDEAKKYGIVYDSPYLVITQISENSFIHTSYLQTEDFGNVPCNGLIVRGNNEVVILDTPTNDEASTSLIQWIQDSLSCTINAVVPTHFHTDNLGGLKTFNDTEITSYAYEQTIEIAKDMNKELPKQSFSDSLILQVGQENVIVKFMGEGHTIDNVIGYFPSEEILFGGCLIKELNADKGNLEDANVYDWAQTVQRIKDAYTNLKIVIPGHGQFGGTELLDYTIDLFK